MIIFCASPICCCCYDRSLCVCGYLWLVELSGYIVQYVHVKPEMFNLYVFLFQYPYIAPKLESADRHKTPSRQPPVPPPPYVQHKKKSSSNCLPYEKPVLTRTKSLEDILSSSPKEHLPQRQHSPPYNRKNLRQVPEPPPRNTQPLMPPHLKDRVHSMDSVDGPVGSPKPRPAKIIAGKARKNGEFSGVKLPELSVSESGGGVTKNTFVSPTHRPLLQSISQPTLGVGFPLTYVAMSSYTSQAPGCLSFSEGDKCVVINTTKDGWWLVNIGGREGWTPGEFWREEKRVRELCSSCVVYIPKAIPLWL